MDERVAVDAETKRAMMRRRATQVKCFATCVIPVGVADVATHTGLGGLILGGAAAVALSAVYPDFKEDFGEMLLPVKELLAPLNAPINGRSIIDRATGRYPKRFEGDGVIETEKLQQVAVATIQTAEVETPPHGESIDPVFVQPERISNVISLRRITIEEMVKHTTFNSYEVWIGRSLTDTAKGNRGVKINFFKRHIKIIGASQHGKSSLAAALIEAIAMTHDNEHVLLAPLDLENKTSRLFADFPHIAELEVGSKVIDLHARNYDEVLERLELICSLIDYRYSLTEEELDQQPIMIVYLEEFIDLKDHFKQLVDVVPAEEKDEALRKYTRLVYCIKKIAARGLKAYVQLLMCAQVDYADEDLKEALANVTSGMSFCVKPSAARAAGFYQTPLLQRNAMEDQVGQFVVEMPECKDLVLAPDYDLKARLRALAEREKATRKTAVMSIPYSQSHPASTLNQGGETMNRMNAEYPVNGLLKPVNSIQNIQNIQEYSQGIQRPFTPTQEAQILNAYAEMLKAGEKVTRTGLRDHLGWGNDSYPVLKAVCDKHHIG